MRSTDCPECRWVPVVDAQGRRRFEMRWQVPVPANSLQRAAKYMGRNDATAVVVRVDCCRS